MRTDVMLRPIPTSGVTGLARETVVDLGHVITQQLAVARLELTAQLHAAAARARVAVILASCIAIGYALVLAALAVTIGGYASVGGPMAAIGLGNIVVSAVLLVFASGPKLPEREKHDAR